MCDARKEGKPLPPPGPWTEQVGKVATMSHPAPLPSSGTQNLGVPREGGPRLPGERSSPSSDARTPPSSSRRVAPSPTPSSALADPLRRRSATAHAQKGKPPPLQDPALPTKDAFGVTASAPGITPGKPPAPREAVPVPRPSKQSCWRRARPRLP